MNSQIEISQAPDGTSTMPPPGLTSIGAQAANESSGTETITQIGMTR